MIDGELLMTLDEQILINDLQMLTIDARRLMLFAKTGWRPKLHWTVYHKDKQEQ